MWIHRLKRRRWVPKPFHLYPWFLFLNTLRLKLNGDHLGDDIFKCMFSGEAYWISDIISLGEVPRVLIDNKVRVMAWNRKGDKPLHKYMITQFTSHICLTGAQCVQFCSAMHVQYAVWYNAIETTDNTDYFLPSTQKRYSISRPWGRIKGRAMWFQSQSYIGSLSLQCYILSLLLHWVSRVTKIPNLLG